MGISKAGFKHAAVIEWDHDTCVTIRENQDRRVEPVSGWPLHEGNVATFNYRKIRGNIDLLAGGPPCQPFSLGGKHLGQHDERNMFPEAVRAVRELQPRAFIFENVKGLLRSSFTNYFEYIKLQLSYPELMRGPEEDWTHHHTRLQEQFNGRHENGLTYRTSVMLLNAADYGVPQSRERVLFVGFREGGADWSFPKPTHSQEQLLWDQWITGDYWERHRIPVSDRPAISPRIYKQVERLRTQLIPPGDLPWRTVRDAIADLPDPMTSDDQMIVNHRFQPGARSYPGHTGCIWDAPAKTLKAGDHGVPGGENMLAEYDGRVRYFTVRESARLQTFPDDYVFPVSWTESMRQLGNAVPVDLGYIIADSVRTRLRHLALNRR